MMDYHPNKINNTRPLTDKQKELLANLPVCNGDPVAAARMAGYADPYAAVRDMREDIVKEAEYIIASMSVEAVMALRNILTSEDGVKQASEKTKAAQIILERTNPKTEKVEIDGNLKQGIFVLPTKRPLDEQEEV